MAARPQDRLRDYKAVIERGLSTFTEVGRALAEIRDSRLYLLRSKSFQAHYRERRVRHEVAWSEWNSRKEDRLMSVT
jgi:hypothetical protein